MSIHSQSNTHTVIALVGVLAAAPIVLFVAANVLIYEFDLFPGVDIAPVSAPLLLGGAFAAVLLNAWSVTEFRATRHRGRLWLMIGFINRPWNVAVIVLAGLFLLFLIGYVVTENIAHALDA